MTSFQKYVYLVFLACTLFVGLFSRAGYFNTDSAYFPFNRWSVFDSAPSEKRDYIVRITCTSDPDEEKVITNLQENFCIGPVRTLTFFKEKNFILLQQAIHMYLIDKNREHLKAQLEKMFNLHDYRKIIILERTYKLKDLYINRKNARYAKIETLTAE